MRFSNTKVCPGKQLCKACFLYSNNGGSCNGCNGYYRLCVKKFCDFQCNECSGGRSTPNTTPGCCGRVNLLERPQGLDYRTILNSKKPERNTVPAKINSNTIFIPIIKRDFRKYQIPEKVPEINTWVVPLRHIFNLKGKFKTTDVKEYLGLSNSNKLILSTHCLDNYLEKLWENREYIDFTKYNIDYWFPAHFSIYDNDSKLYQFVSAKRQMIHGTISNSQFRWFRLSITLPVEFLDIPNSFPSILIATNVRSKISIQILQNELEIADDYFKNDVDFYFVGGISRIKNQIPMKHRIFIINENWMIKAFKGKDIYDQLYTEYTKEDREIMLLKNLREELKNAEKYRV